MKKYITFLQKVSMMSLCVLCLNLTAMPVYASEPDRAAAVECEDTISPRKEVTEWKFRMKDNKLQKRLWSVTYNKWLTDWIDVN